MIIGELGNFTAYAFAPAALVAPLGTFTVVSNAFIAVCFFGEHFRWRDVAGVMLSAVGVVLVVFVGPKTDESVTVDELIEDMLQTPFMVYILSISLMGLLLFVMVFVYEQENLIAILVLTSVCGSYTILSAKSLASLLSSTVSGNIQLGSPMLYVLLFILIVTGLSQVHFLNLALRHYSSSEVVPTYFALFTIGAIVGSALLFNDFKSLTNNDLVVFFFGCFLAFCGVYLITSKREATRAQERESAILIPTSDPDSSQAVLISRQHEHDENSNLEERENMNCFSPTFGVSRTGYSKLNSNEPHQLGTLGSEENPNESEISESRSLPTQTSKEFIASSFSVSSPLITSLQRNRRYMSMLDHESGVKTEALSSSSDALQLSRSFSLTAYG